jgi:hypothetical protein
MIAHYQAIIQRIRLEIEEIERTQAAVQRHWRGAKTSSTDQDAFINSVALNLHSFYSGLERIFELIATEIDGGTLGSEGWHSELIRQMTLDLPNIRPPMLQINTAEQLDDYRKFRHRVRNIYTTHLDPERMSPLVDKLPALWEKTRTELTAFLEFLEQLAQSDSD